MKEAEEKANQLYLDYKQNGHKVPPNYRAFCYSAGIRLGTNDDWNFAYKMYNETLVASERSLWMRALAASPHVYVLQQYVTHPDGIFTYHRSLYATWIYIHISIFLNLISDF